MAAINDKALAEAFAEMGLGTERDNIIMADLETRLSDVVNEYSGRSLAEVREALLALQRETGLKLSGIDRLSVDISRGVVRGD